MKKFKHLSLAVLILSSVFITGCNVEEVLGVINNISNAVQQAAPAISDTINAVSSITQSISSAGSSSSPASSPATTEQGSGSGASASIISPTAEGVQGSTGSGSSSGSAMQRRVSSAIKSLVGSTRFRGPEVDGGNLACAQVVSTALQQAGVLSRVSVNCDAVVSDLRRVGWQRVNVPPYQDGDVVTWTTRRGPGRHIGIIVQEGNSFVAISNSSSQRTPRRHAINYQPITQVLRKV